MKTRLLLIFSAILAASVFFVGPVSQDLAYHQFADDRMLFGIANFWNVVSNVMFVIVGGAGLWYLRVRTRRGIVDSLYPAYLVFFIGVFLSGLGSAWYHAAPDNNTLVWDRLPMTMAFMALLTIVIGEHGVSASARRLLFPLLIVGAVSVYYWHYTESNGEGDLRPYALVQFMPMILIPTILLAFRSCSYSRRIYWSMILLYAISKLFEYFDYNVYETGNIISGHSIKHVVAAFATAAFLYGIIHRQPANLDRTTE